MGQCHFGENQRRHSSQNQCGISRSPISLQNSYDCDTFARSFFTKAGSPISYGIKPSWLAMLIGYSSHELETLEVQKMNQRPYLLFEIHSMLLFHFTNGWHYLKIIKIILGTQVTALFLLFVVFYMGHITWAMLYTVYPIHI